MDQINDLLKPDNVNRIGRILQNLEGVTVQMSAMVSAPPTPLLSALNVSLMILSPVLNQGFIPLFQSC